MIAGPLVPAQAASLPDAVDPTASSRVAVRVQVFLRSRVALDVSLAVQHLVDPEEVPLEAYVPLFDLLFGSLVDTEES